MTTLLADVIAVAHATIAMFVVLSVAAICLGAVLNWRWTKNVTFRTTHFAVITFIMARIILGAPCPLSVWEDNIRGHKPTGAVAKLAFRGADQNTFQIGCAILFALTALFPIQSALERQRARRTISPSSDACSRASVRARIHAS
jgi:hypothetical protein